MFTFSELGQIIIFIVALTVLTPFIGSYISRVFNGNRNSLTPIIGKMENYIYRLTKINPTEEMDWKTYTLALCIFNFLGFIILFLIQMFQSYLPLNPERLPNVSWDLALNTAISFMTNTNWQSYSGETTLSYFSQMVGLTVQNFLSAATGIAVMLALIRGLTHKSTRNIGNFWVDLVRSTIYVLIPLAIILSIVLVGQGVVQTFSSHVEVTTIEGAKQVIPLGPAASQIAIKQLGTNGGGFFGANSAHPFENPTPLSNFLEVIAILLLPSSLVYTYGKMIGSTRQGWTLWGSMMFLLIILLSISLWSEYHSNPVSQTTAGMEGKETRFGVGNSVVWSVATTAASNGSVNAMHDSLTPISGLIAMLNIMLGEIIFGGVGAGMYGMIIFVILTVFIAGLMVGRTPEYLGKKIESFEIKMAVLAVLIPCVVILLFSAIGLSPICLSPGSINMGPHGLSQILYAFTSAAGNNGSAFAGLNTNTVFYNIFLGIGMLAGRFGVIIPILAIAGKLSIKNIVPLSTGTFRTDTLLFAALLIGIILIVGALTFFPALSLGPIVEHLLTLQGHSF
jgi:potassium-transporting ATPase potassium-binding subunit